MKRASGGRKSSAAGVVGGIPLQINFDDAARLVGGIVEKGFTDASGSRPLVPPVAPRPNFLPFPVACHRSSGPHWSPDATDDSDDLDWDAYEEEDSEGMERFAIVANPVQRKEKKVLDLNSWKKIAQGDEKGRQRSRPAVSHKYAKKDYDYSSSRKAEVEDPNLGRKPKVDHHMDQKVSSFTEKTEGNKGMPLLHDDSEDLDDAGETENGVDVASSRPPHSIFSKSGEHGGEEAGIASEIDAENSARLAKMSKSEIAEAQAEIMQSLNPELINALRKRGQSKNKGQNSVAAGVEADSTQHDKKSTGDHKGDPGKLIADKKMKDKRNNISPVTSPEIRHVWDTWSKRVEEVRHMRFSLDGSIIRDSALGSDIGNVTERDFIRTEGDPGASGYTVKEAVALTRSVVPGQRAFALHLIADMLHRAIRNIWQNCATLDLDGEAIWAYCLGPEPELALSLRLCLDDNHNTVVLACAKAIQHALSFDVNDSIFDILDRTPSVGSNTFTAPVFRTKPDPNHGFLRGGFWKYNTKPANILPGEVGLMGGEREGESERTIQDDIVVTTQDFAAGLVRMGILQRINYLLENDPAPPLEECLISILIAIARHSPVCAAAVMASGQLVQTVARRFASAEQMEINSCKIKSVVLIKVLAQVDKKNCLIFMNNWIFRQVTWQLYRYPFSLDQSIKSGTKAWRLFSDLMVEQLRLWKVFIHYGFCISDFSDLFPSLCTWLAVPTVEKLVDADVDAYYAITREAYLLLDVLACKLPKFYSDEHEPSQYDDIDEDTKAWSWNQVAPIIDLALEWIKLKSIPDMFRTADDVPSSYVNSVIWVISSVLGMLCSVLKALIRGDSAEFPNDRLPWLPEFVPRIGLAIASNGILSFSGGSDAIRSEQLSSTGTILQYFYLSRFKGSLGLAMSATCCLQELIQVAASIDRIIQSANLKIHHEPSMKSKSSIEDQSLANGILKSFSGEIKHLLQSLSKLIDADWYFVRNVEMFGRGGPSPGVGIGWGASDGGYWSINTLLAQEDARLLCYLLELSDIQVAEDPLEAGETEYTQQILCGALKSLLILCPGKNSVADKLLKFICQAPVLKYLGYGIRQFLLNKRHDPFQWRYEEDEYHKIAEVLTSHFTKRWLGAKNKRKKSVKKGNLSLHTIYEDSDLPGMSGPMPSSLTVEWASSRLPLPTHWFLSAVSSICSESNTSGITHVNQTNAPSDFLEVAKSGLFFLLGLEAIPDSGIPKLCSPAKYVPIVWKLHALSVILLPGMDILADEKSRDLYSTLQDVYAESMDQLCSQGSQCGTALLPFKSEIHENYPTFIEKLVEQFAAESYGDILFGRQVAMYLHGSVEASVRLATWNALSNSCALELLPPMDKCFGNAEGYLEPIEDDEGMLEAYVKSWGSGALDRAASRCSMGFSLPLHHLSSFIFGNVADTMLPLRTKLAKSLLRDYSRKQQHENMLVKLICYRGSSSSPLSMNEVETRLQRLKQFSQGNLERLESRVRSEVR